MSGFEQCRLAMDATPVASGLQTIWFQTDNPASPWRPECIVLEKDIFRVLGGTPCVG